MPDCPVPAALPCFVTGTCLPWSVRRGLWPSQGTRPLLIPEWIVRPSQLCTESERDCGGAGGRAGQKGSILNVRSDPASAEMFCCGSFVLCIFTFCWG